MKNRKLFDEILRYAAERGIDIPADVLLDTSREDAKALINQLNVTVDIRPSDLPLFTKTQPGAVPPAGEGKILSSEGWIAPPQARTIMVGSGSGGGNASPLPANAQGVLMNDGIGNLYWENEMKVDTKYQTNNLDDVTTTGVTYIGQEDDQGVWKIFKIDETGATPIFTYASITNNPTLTTYALAWAGRVLATYSEYSNAF